VVVMRCEYYLNAIVPEIPESAIEIPPRRQGQWLRSYKCLQRI
jgi:hypothetical protein